MNPTNKTSVNILYISEFVLTDMPQEVWGKLADEYSELREKLILLGANENTASVLLCLHYHGASTSKELQSQCNIRQPDVSMAISELREMNLVHYSPRSESSRGRPAHIYSLRMNLENSLQPFENRARKRAKDLLNQVDEINRLVAQVESKGGRTFTAA